MKTYASEAEFFEEAVQALFDEGPITIVDTVQLNPEHGKPQMYVHIGADYPDPEGDDEDGGQMKGKRLLHFITEITVKEKYSLKDEIRKYEEVIKRRLRIPIGDAIDTVALIESEEDEHQVTIERIAFVEQTGFYDDDTRAGGVYTLAYVEYYEDGEE